MHTPLSVLQELVEAQAEDDGLWFNAETATEAYLQAALRRLHAAVEAMVSAPPEGVGLTQREVDAIYALRHAHEWVMHQPHGDNCFVSNHYEGDPGNRCNCGKDSAEQVIGEALLGYPEAMDDDGEPIEVHANSQQPVYQAPSLNEGRMQPAWVSVEERLPELGTECLVWCREAAPGFGPYAKVDTWEEQREAPVGWSSATIPIGPGWNESEFEDVLYWQPLTPPAALAPPHPAQAGGHEQ